MVERTEILFRFHAWTQEVNPFKRKIAQFWEKLVIEAKYRLSGSVSISIIAHLILLIGYLGIDALDQPIESPIQEISFIDMNEIEEEPEEVIVKKETTPIVKAEVPPPPEEEQEPAYEAQEQRTPEIALGNERIFLDTERKQAPINVNEFEPVSGNVNQPNDVLSVSPAIGIKKDEKISKSAALDLGKKSDMLIPASSGPSQAVTFGKSGKPQIDLNPSSKGAVSTGAVSNNFAPSKPKPEKTKPELKPKETQTIITGALANREILEKVIPQFPYWARTKGVGATISLRFTVMENGIVKETVIVERTSGSLQWDQMVISALKQWKFVPLKSGGLRQDQSGVITFQFVI